MSTIKYWALNKKLVFPEVKANRLALKADVGIALPGGGMKAAVLSLGWLQVFHELDLLKRVKYISSVSGGAWTSAPMINSPATVTMDKFLGNTIPPDQCTIENLNSFATKPGSHANVLTAAKFTRNIIWDFFTRGFRKDTSDFWAQTVGRIFLEPHGIDKNAIGLNERTNLPFQIVNGAIQTGGKRGAVPVEFTPMYYGVPIKHKQRMYDDNLAFFYRSIDAVYVEPKGFQVKVDKSVILDLVADDGQTISVPANQKIQELKCKEIVGISSEFFAHEFGPMLPQYTLPQFIYTALNFPAFQFFNNGVQRFVDGGSSDVTGILALLRRGCTHIVAGIVCDASVNDSVDAKDCKKTTFGHYAGLFGVQTSAFAGQSSQKYNENRKVFDSAKWDEFLTALQTKRRNGQPVVHRMTLAVLPNALIGVTGNYNVDIIFASSDICPEFESKLPLITQQRLTKDRAQKSKSQGTFVDFGLAEGDLRDFPFISLQAQDYPPLLTGLLSQHASYTLMTYKDEIMSMFPTVVNMHLYDDKFYDEIIK